MARDGAPPVQLIDGERQCDLLKDYGLGVAVEQGTLEEVVVQPAFFQEYELGPLDGGRIGE